MELVLAVFKCGYALVFAFSPDFGGLRSYVEQFLDDSKWEPPRALRPGPMVTVCTVSS